MLYLTSLFLPGQEDVADLGILSWLLLTLLLVACLTEGEIAAQNGCKGILNPIHAHQLS
jgi:hypothetical protein